MRWDRGGTRPFVFGGSSTPAVKALLVANVVVFLFQMLSQSLAQVRIERLFGLIPYEVVHHLFLWQRSGQILVGRYRRYPFDPGSPLLHAEDGHPEAVGQRGRNRLGVFRQDDVCWLADHRAHTCPRTRRMLPLTTRRISSSE